MAPEEPVSPDAGPPEPWRNLGVVAAIVGVAVVAALFTRARMREAVAPSPPPSVRAPAAVDLRARRLAVPGFVARRDDEASHEACRALTSVLRDDLAFESVLDLVPAEEAAAVLHLNPERPNLGHWRSAGAGALVFGRAQVAGEDLTVEATVFDVDSGRVLASWRHGGGPGDARALAHRLSDDLLGLAGLRGVARTRIAFNSDRHSTPEGRVKEIYVMDYDGHAPTRVTVSRPDYAAPGVNVMPAWHPAGDRLAYVSFTPGAASIFVSRFPGGPAANVSAGWGQAFAPAWSPDGRQLAFSSARSGNPEIWVAEADGSRPRRLTTCPAAETAPSWSPTGREIAFTSDRSGRPQVYVVGADGRDVRQVTTQGKYNDAAAWNPSPEHPEIAYTSLGKGGFEIAVVDLATGGVRKVAEGQGDCEYPTWAPGGRHLAFACGRGGSRQITVADREGRWVRTLPAGPGHNEYPDWGP